MYVYACHVYFRVSGPVKSLFPAFGCQGWTDETSDGGIHGVDGTTGTFPRKSEDSIIAAGTRGCVVRFNKLLLEPWLEI